MKKMIDLSKTSLHYFKSEKIYETENKHSRLIEFVLQKGDEISPHLHPYGEDCALVLEGELTYYITNNKTVQATKGDVVFGWKNVIHGYKNLGANPVHLLIFASPEETGLDYVSDDNSKVLHLPLCDRMMKKDETNSSKKRGLGEFTNIIIEGVFVEPTKLNNTHLYVDSISKKIFIFQNESVNISTKSPVLFLKYKNIS